jgi:hypothetical protein
MTHLIDADALIDTFAETDPRMPLLVFALLSLYRENGPFQFDAARIAEQLSTLNLKARVNPEELASLQPDLERFFETTTDGWVPRGGVLAYEGEATDAAHSGAKPGDLSARTH